MQNAGTQGYGVQDAGVQGYRGAGVQDTRFRLQGRRILDGGGQDAGAGCSYRVQVVSSSARTHPEPSNQSSWGRAAAPSCRGT